MPNSDRAGDFFRNLMAGADQVLFDHLANQGLLGDLLRRDRSDLPADGKFYVPVKVDDRTSLVLGPPSEREQNARPVGAQPAPARAESAHGGGDGGDSYTCTLRTEYGLDLKRPKSRNARKMARVDGVR